MGSVPGSGAAVWLSVWVSARSDLEKVPAFFEFAGTFFAQSQSRPTEALFTS